MEHFCTKHGPFTFEGPECFVTCGECFLEELERTPTPKPFTGVFLTFEKKPELEGFAEFAETLREALRTGTVKVVTKV